jgi:hypothetical protein
MDASSTAAATMTTNVAVTAATSTQSIADYLAQLLKDKKQLAAFPNVFVHMERLLDDGKFIISHPKMGWGKVLPPPS